MDLAKSFSFRNINEIYSSIDVFTYKIIVSGELIILVLSKDYIFKGVKRQRSFFVSKNYRTTIFPSNSSHQRVLDRKKIKIIDDHFDNPSIKEKYPCYPLLFQSNLTSDPFPPLDSIKSFDRPPRLFLTLEHLRLGEGGGEEAFRSWNSQARTPLREKSMYPPCMLSLFFNPPIFSSRFWFLLISLWKIFMIKIIYINNIFLFTILNTKIFPTSSDQKIIKLFTISIPTFDTRSTNCSRQTCSKIHVVPPFLLKYRSKRPQHDSRCEENR